MNKICDENCFECKFADCVLPDHYCKSSTPRKLTRADYWRQKRRQNEVSVLCKKR